MEKNGDGQSGHRASIVRTIRPAWLPVHDKLIKEVNWEKMGNSSSDSKRTLISVILTACIASGLSATMNVFGAMKDARMII
jgi:hypothetical protein